MILHTGMRTDIPAYYSDWFYNRIREGYVLTRNPYYPQQVIRYKLHPDIVDCLCFCTKNPEPMLSRLHELDAFRQFWFVTITPYGKDVEPNVPEKRQVMDAFLRLSDRVGIASVGWRYDPVFLTEKYDLAFHKEAFAQMAETLSGHVDQCVISFIRLYAKTRRNFPQARSVTQREREELARSFVKTGKKYGIQIRTCCEGKDLAPYGVDTSGCMSKEVLERAIGTHLSVPASRKSPRADCNCLIGNDIGMYNTCGHGCLYCYANYDMHTVWQNMRQHDSDSPFLIGGSMDGDNIKNARQTTYIDGQLSFFL